MRWILLLSIGLTACGGPAGPGEPAPSPMTDRLPTPPERLGAFRSIGSRDSGGDDGVQTRYVRRDGAYADVYVYPVPLPDAACPLDCLDAWVNGEADEFRGAVLPGLVTTRTFAASEVVSDSLLSLPLDGASRARHLVAKVRSPDGVEGRTEFLLTAARGYRIKMRLTDFARDFRDGDAPKMFAEQVSGMEWPYSCPTAPAELGPTAAIRSTFTAPPLQVLRTIEATFGELGYSLKSRGDGWITAPRFDWPFDTGSDAMFAGDNPGHQVIVSAYPAAPGVRPDSVALEVSAALVCEPNDTGTMTREDAHGAYQLTLSAWFAKALSDALREDGLLPSP